MKKEHSISLLRREFNTELIEIIIPANTTKFKIQFEDQQNLRNVKLMGINVFTEDMVPISMVSENPVATFALLRFIFLTLQAYNGENFVWQKPVPTLIDQENAVTIQNYAPTSFTRQRVNWPKSYIEIAAGAPIPIVDTVMLLEVNYIDRPTKEAKRQDARFKKRS